MPIEPRVGLIAFKQGEEFRKFFEADAHRLADGVRKVGRVEQK